MSSVTSNRKLRRQLRLSAKSRMALHIWAPPFLFRAACTLTIRSFTTQIASAWNHATSATFQKVATREWHQEAGSHWRCGGSEEKCQRSSGSHQTCCRHSKAPLGWGICRQSAASPHFLSLSCRIPFDPRSRCFSLARSTSQCTSCHNSDTATPKNVNSTTEF